MTRELVEAEELWTMESVNPEGYVCPGCELQLFPASYDRKVNLKRPYFRVGPEKKHARDCRVGGEEKITARARTQRIGTPQGFPVPFPSSLVVTDDRPVTGEVGVGLGPVRGGAAGGRTDRAGSSGLYHGHTVKTIRPICRAFLNMPFDRDAMPLRVPGVQGSTYAEVFRHAKSTLGKTGEVSALFYAPLRWMAEPVESDEACEVMLNAGEWDDAAREFKSPFRVRLHWAGWSRREQQAFLAECGAAYDEAKEQAGKKGDIKGWLFFVGRLDATDRSLFHVDRYRFVCALADAMVTPYRAGAGARR
ncbi:hypothetical protein [Luteibacter aegosomatissinici]|uniref:hypothetical protein n=1 Tax=Luteibacter aegosomatissinici TaxID=2911539 RepID=UPI001FFAEFC5|nr:hypothetical protein [Luteibacter aegosomatissinici]UPG92684.1 hypothetical protein L2Y97_12490 [Luteibacter aegosomatissinici]